MAVLWASVMLAMLSAITEKWTTTTWQHCIKYCALSLVESI